MKTWLIVLGVVVFAVWPFRDLKKAREQSRLRREPSSAGAPAQTGEGQSQSQGPSQENGTRPPGSP